MNTWALSVRIRDGVLATGDRRSKSLGCVARFSGFRV